MLSETLVMVYFNVSAPFPMSALESQGFTVGLGKHRQLGVQSDLEVSGKAACAGIQAPSSSERSINPLVMLSMRLVLTNNLESASRASTVEDEPSAQARPVDMKPR